MPGECPTGQCLVGGECTIGQRPVRRMLYWAAPCQTNALFDSALPGGEGPFCRCSGAPHCPHLRRLAPLTRVNRLRSASPDALNGPSPPDSAFPGVSACRLPDSAFPGVDVSSNQQPVVAAARPCFSRMRCGRKLPVYRSRGCRGWVQQADRGKCCAPEQRCTHPRDPRRQTFEQTHAYAARIPWVHALE